MKAYYLLFINVIFFSCVNSKGDKISLTQFTEDSFQESFIKVENALKESPNKPRLIEQKLLYCEELSWPKSCLDALEKKKFQEGMNTGLVKQFLDYYKENDDYVSLADLIIQWDEVFNVKNNYYTEYLHGLVLDSNYQYLSIELPNYLFTNRTFVAYMLAGDTYLAIGDSLLSIFYYSRANRLRNGLPDNYNLIYPQLLMNVQASDRAFKSMYQFVKNDPSDTTYALYVAKIMIDSSRNEMARNVLMNFLTYDTIAFRVADLFKEDLKWDSAIAILDLLILNNPFNKVAKWKRARYYEDRGWLSYSLKYFDQVIALDSLDTLAIERKNLIKRKIAYLQRKKFEGSKIPIKEINVKKRIINNE